MFERNELVLNTMNDHGWTPDFRNVLLDVEVISHNHLSNMTVLLLDNVSDRGEGAEQNKSLERVLSRKDACRS